MRPPIVCICGSTRFHDTWEEANLNETLASRIVLMVGAFAHSDDDLELTRHQKAKLDVLHMHKIWMCDEILVLNVDGYVGESTEREIEMAISMGKPVRWWDPTQIPEQWKTAYDKFVDNGLSTMEDVRQWMGVDPPLCG